EVRVRVVPVVAALPGSVPGAPGRAGVDRGAGREAPPVALIHAVALSVEVPLGQLCPHPLVVRPEIFLPTDERGVHIPQDPAAGGALTWVVGLLENQAATTRQRQYQSVVGDVGADQRLQRAVVA